MPSHYTSNAVVPTQFFIQDQYNQLIQLLNKNSVGDANAHIADTGAINHMTGTKDLLHNKLSIGNTGQVQLPTRDLATISHMGECQVTGCDTLKDVLFVPVFKFNILSVSKMITKDLKRYVIFFPQCCVFQDLLSGKVKEIGKEDDGLYVLSSSVRRKVNRAFAVTSGAGKSLYEMLHGKQSSISHLRVIGCLCFATNLIKHDKFKPRAMRSVLLAYAAHQKGYMLLDLEHSVFFISRDIVFYEDLFPFQSLDLDSTPIAIQHLAVIHTHGKEIRKSGRVSKPPIWMQDYIPPTKEKYVVAANILSLRGRMLLDVNGSIRSNTRLLELQGIGSSIKWMCTIFLQGDLIEVYMTVPQGFNDSTDKSLVCKLLKSLYGLKQASRQWNIKLTTILQTFGFSQSYLDYSLFIKQASGKLVTKDDLQSSFKIKDLGELKFFLGIEFTRSDKRILMHQRKYALELISDLGLAGSKHVHSPIEQNLKLTTTEFDDHIASTGDSVLSDPGPYQRLLGKLLYLTITRPDISFAVQCLSQFMHKPKTSHMEDALRVVRFVKSSPGLSVLLSVTRSYSLSAFYDVDWVACPNTRMSITGYFVKFGNSLISWKSKKESAISRSSAEAEYRSLASTMAEVIWILGLFKELGVSHSSSVPIYYDSKSAIQIVVNLVFHEGTKHIDIDCHFIREKVRHGLISTIYVLIA
ncbi:uncharacterized protein LOC142175892 [Nicotiana tabacum]|uniref:Uncharacterized protein LOC142175892 n=1 Tax=Nicotiana tabacum TaxID=4097 RepID=A0AC58TP49_TOBAC